MGSPFTFHSQLELALALAFPLAFALELCLHYTAHSSYTRYIVLRRRTPKPYPPSPDSRSKTTPISFIRFSETRSLARREKFQDKGEERTPRVPPPARQKIPLGTPRLARARALFAHPTP
jgi:hypothetical protein